MGFLNDLDIENTEADPDALPDGKYPGWLFESKILTKKDGSKTSLVLTYKVDKDFDPKFANRKAQEWFQLKPVPSEQQKAWLKRRLVSLGIPESKMNEIEPDDLIGIAVTFGVKNSNGYKNVNFVELRDEDGEFEAPSAASAESIEDLL